MVEEEKKCSWILAMYSCSLCMVKITAGNGIVLFSFESQQSCDSDHTDSYDMGDDCTQDLGSSSSFIIHPRLAQTSQKI